MKLYTMRTTWMAGCLLVLLACDDGGGPAGLDAGGGDGGGNGGGSGDPGGAASAGTSGGGGGTGGFTGGGSGTIDDVPRVGDCPVFTSDDAWNTEVAQASVNVDYTARLMRFLDGRGNPNLHPDFGADYLGMPFGIPINVVPMDQAASPIAFDYDDESDPGPYPFPPPDSVEIEGGDPYATDGDRHVLAVQQGTCTVYEAWACNYDGGWRCGSGAKFDLTKNSYDQRPKGYTSADAAGLSILAGLVRYDEVQAGEIRHAIRFTLSCSADAFTAPGSHRAVPGSCDGADPDAMPMGVRVRLAQSYDISGLKGAARIVAQAMKTYGMILADNGSDFYFQGEPDTRWSDDDLNGLKGIASTAFEVVGPVAPER